MSVGQSGRAAPLCVLLLWSSLAVARTAPQGPSAELLCARGIGHYQRGHLASAVADLRRALEVAPQLESAAHYLGVALIRQGRLSQGRRILSKAARWPEPSARLLYDLGLAYLAEKNHVWASRSFRRAAEAAPNESRIRHALSLALLRMGKAEEAVDQLEQAPAASGDDEPLRLLRATALYRAQRWNDSLDLLARTGRRGHAHRLVRANLEATGTSASWLSAEVAAGVMLDSNPFYREVPTSPSGIGPEVRAVLTLRPWVTARNLLFGEVGFRRWFAFAAAEVEQGVDGEDPRDMSATDAELVAGYMRRIPRQSGAWSLGAAYTLGLFWLDGRQFTDPNNFFLESHQGKLTAAWSSNSGLHALFRYTLSREIFALYPRNNWGNEIEGEVGFPFWGQRMRFLGSAHLRYEKAEVSFYDAVSPGVSLGLSWVAPLDLVLGVGVEYELESYIDWSASGVGLDRDDHNLLTTVELGRSLPFDLHLQLLYQLVKNFSSEAGYSYLRHTVSLGLRWSYP